MIGKDRPIGMAIDGAGTFRMAIPAGVLLEGANSTGFFSTRPATPPDHIEDQRVLNVEFKEFGFDTGSQPGSTLAVLQAAPKIAGISVSFDAGCFASEPEGVYDSYERH